MKRAECDPGVMEESGRVVPVRVRGVDAKIQAPPLRGREIWHERLIASSVGCTVCLCCAATSFLPLFGRAVLISHQKTTVVKTYKKFPFIQTEHMVQKDKTSTSAACRFQIGPRVMFKFSNTPLSNLNSQPCTYRLFLLLVSLMTFDFSI